MNKEQSEDSKEDIPQEGDNKEEQSPLEEKKPEKTMNNKKKLYSGIGLVVLILIVVAIVTNSNGDHVTSPVEKRTITKIAEFSGTVVAADKVDLAFEVPGKVLGVPVDVGNSVAKGSVLARLTSSGEQALVRGAEADLLAAEAKLRDLEMGARPEEVDVQKQKIANAEVSLEDAIVSLADSIRKSFTTSDDAVRNLVDALFTNSRSLTPELVFNTDFQLETDIESNRATLERDLITWESSIDNGMLEADISGSLNQALTVTEDVKAFLFDIASAVNKLTPTASYSATTLDGWKTDVALARTNIDAAISNLTSSREALNAAIAAVNLAEEELVLIEAGATQDQIDEARANVKAKRALLDQYKSDVAKRVLLSPISGIVTERTIEPGEVVQANAIVMSVISDAAFEVEADASELDIAGILVGNLARITLDAYGDKDIFEATVTHVDPAETIIDNVPTYGVTLQFVEEDERVRSGMTANVFVVTDELENVIAIPASTISFKTEDPTVEVLREDGRVEEVIISIGLRGSDGYVEVLSGLKEGDLIIE